jgi:hypothetical protein
MKRFVGGNPELMSWLGAIGIPLAIAVGLVGSTYFVTKSIENAKLDSEYIRMALGILSKDKTKKDEDSTAEYSDEEMALRRWAVRLLNLKSPEKFNDKEREALEKAYGSGWMEFGTGQDGSMWSRSDGESWRLISPGRTSSDKATPEGPPGEKRPAAKGPRSPGK